eukprot:2911764-Amphidinium_carterae.1
MHAMYSNEGQLWPARCKAQLQLAALGREGGIILAASYGLSGANGNRDIGATTLLSRATAMFLEGMVATTCRAVRLLETTNMPALQ